MSSQSCHGNESNSVNKEGNVAPSSVSENQLVLYDPRGNETEEEGAEPNQSQTSSHKTQCPSIGAFTVQCATCLKWRLMPSMEKYEEIREQILEKPFYCETACEWKANVTCDVAEDISQDGTRVWAIDRPSISRPPAGWQRQLRIRGEGGTKFADVYYVTPSGKKLRSNVEVQKYLNENPEYITQGVKLSQFSFQIPKPLRENYVRKRPARPMEPSDAPVAIEANPLALVSPDAQTPLQPTEPGLCTHLKKARRSEPSS
ncbi:methyl-CpG-binding domain-containing protein 2 isoform X1 [Brassica rapa]|uniref:MBD domain-containing protein n=1 Tax=Brassica campestris TaxID=3711 RepID=M4FCW6_BRACM|nr:methyl-CpG-binding domain-containing protein 2 isoform X1 [Brassica rapa]